MTMLSFAPAVYWRLRCLQTEADNASLRQQLAAGRYELALARAITEAGGTPGRRYQWHDATTSLHVDEEPPS